MDDNKSVDANRPDYYTDTVNHCIYGLRHGDVHERCNAADILRGLAWDAEPALPVIIEFMGKDENKFVRAGCAHALCDIGYSLKEKSHAAVAPLIEALQHDEYEEVRSLAANALGEIGPTAKAAIPTLQKALEDRHEWVREAAQEALDQLDSMTTETNP